MLVESTRTGAVLADEAHTSVALHEAVDLAGALVDHKASGLGIRALIIKGNALSAQNLRPQRVSSDVDLLVEPGRDRELLDALATLGWRRRPSNADELTFPPHSHSLINAQWPCDIDLHFRYPGIESPDAFDALWSHRETVVLAGVEVQTLNRIANALIMALHCLRAPYLARHSYELDQLTLRLTSEDYTELLALAGATGSQRALVPLLIAAGREDLVQPDWQEMSEEWVIRTSIPSNVARRWHYWRTLPLRDRVAYAYRALFPPIEEFRVLNLYGDFGPRAMAKLYLVRLKKGAFELPAALRQIRRFK